jgi:hypothetical protein
MNGNDGIYVLVTPKNNNSEYRVAHIYNIGRLHWEEAEKGWTNNHDNAIKNARVIFKDATLHTERAAALIDAHNMAKQLKYIQFGVSEIEIRREF